MRGQTVRNLALVTGLAGSLAMGAALAQPAQPLPSHIMAVPLDAPSVRIANGMIGAQIYLTDSAKGFYRGTRFDQSGVVGSLTFGSQDFYGPWFDHVSPDVLDFIFTPDGIIGGPDSATSGPVEEFAPMGFDEAATGGTFLKIGVGILRKPDTKPYDHYHLYDIVDAGRREVRSTKTSVSFTQNVAHGFRYQKILRLVTGRPQMRIEHVLTNESGKPFSTTVYDHNFLKLSPGNRDIVVTLPFHITPDKAPDENLVRIDGDHFGFVRPLTGNESASFHITGFGTTMRDYDIKVDDTKTGAGVQVIADQPLSEINVWSIRSVMAVEPYIDIDLAPGATKRWTYTYTYKAPTH